LFLNPTVEADSNGSFIDFNKIITTIFVVEHNIEELTINFYFWLNYIFNLGDLIKWKMYLLFKTTLK